MSSYILGLLFTHPTHHWDNQLSLLCEKDKTAVKHIISCTMCMMYVYRMLIWLICVHATAWFCGLSFLSAVVVVCFTLFALVVASCYARIQNNTLFMAELFYLCIMVTNVPLLILIQPPLNQEKKQLGSLLGERALDMVHIECNHARLLVTEPSGKWSLRTQLRNLRTVTTSWNLAYTQRQPQRKYYCFLYSIVLC